MCKTSKLLLGLVLASSLSVASAKQKIIALQSLGIRANQATNTAPRLNFIIDSLKKSQALHDSITLLFTPGTYYFEALESPEEELYISNHDQTGKRHIGIKIEGLHHLTLDGMGSEFIFRDRMLSIAIISSKNIFCKGFSVDFTEPQISQVEITRNLGKEGMEYRPAPWVKWRINAKNEFECYGSNWSNTPQSGIVFEPLTRHTKYRVSDLGFSTNDTRVIGANKLYSPHWIDERLSPGDVIAMR